MDKFLNWLKSYWFLIAALASLSAAWGQSQMKIQTLEDAVKQTATTQAEVSKLKDKTGRIDERTQALQSSIARQESMILLLLQNNGMSNKTIALKLDQSKAVVEAAEKADKKK